MGQSQAVEMFRKKFETYKKKSFLLSALSIQLKILGSENWLLISER
jgi:hypothetical protein